MSAEWWDDAAERDVAERSIEDELRDPPALDPARSRSRRSRGGRTLLDLEDLVVRETPATPLAGVGLELAGGGLLDVHDAERLRDELNIWLVSRGVRAQ
jgi:hypothetical protein